MSESQAPAGPDLAAGFPVDQLPPDDMVAGHVGESAVLLARVGPEIVAIGGQCTHYGGPLGEGLRVGDTVRCPWHHACFHLKTGEALKAPALRPVSRWKVEQRDGRCYVTREIPADDGATPIRQPAGPVPASVVIVGAGAAGNAAAEMLRREGYQGPITLIGADPDIPYDRPNLSKDYLAGTAPEEWIPLRDPDFYRAHNITLVLGRTVTGLDPAARRITLDDGTAHSYDALLLATGGEPRRLPSAIDGGGRVRYLRSLADCRAIIQSLDTARRAVVIGASFIGLEVSASLRARGLEVDVVAPEPLPLVKVMGAHLAGYIRDLHQDHRVRFHLGRSVKEVTGDGVRLDNDERLPADLVVAGIGVTPRDQLAAQAGLKVENGVIVDPRLRTSDPRIYAAGDIARYPDPRTGELVRIEHWVVAERQGQTVAKNMLGQNVPFTDVPFFWSQHYDVPIAYCGHAGPDAVEEVSGNASHGDVAVRFQAGGQVQALATIGRDRESLRFEIEGIDGN